MKNKETATLHTGSRKVKAQKIKQTTNVPGRSRNTVRYNVIQNITCTYDMDITTN